MFNPDIAPVSTFMPSFETAARSLKVAPIPAAVHSDAEIETAIVALGREPGGGLAVMPDAWTALHRAPIISAAARNNVPAVYGGSANGSRFGERRDVRVAKNRGVDPGGRARGRGAEEAAGAGATSQETRPMREWT